MIPRYQDPVIEATWSEQSYFTQALRVELAHFQALTGRTFDVHLDVETIRALEQDTRHETVAFIQHVSRQLSPEDARMFHYGLTSSDIIDTTTVLLINESCARVTSLLEKLTDAFTHMGIPREIQVIARTHGQVAEPTTLGAQLLGHVYELECLQDCCPLFYGKLSGPVGNNRHNDPEVERHALSMLGLAPHPCPTQVVPRSDWVPIWQWLFQISLAMERFALQVRLHQTLGEWQEPFGLNQAGSSAMPHKRNPIISEQVTGLCRMIRSQTNLLSEQGLLWMERDMTHSSVERVTIPDVFHLTCTALAKCEHIVKGLTFNTERIQQYVQEAVLSSDVLLARVAAGEDRETVYQELCHGKML